MGRKRKSDLISNDDNISVVDLTDVYEIEDDASLTSPTPDLPASKIYLPEVYSDLVGDGRKDFEDTTRFCC